MKVIKISCPNCHNAFTLKTQNPNALMAKEFKCPKCGFFEPFSMLLGGKPSDNPALHTHIAGGGFAPSAGFGALKTKVAGQTQACSMSLVVESTGRSFPLKPGTYILGRASSDSKATLKLAPDPYMSRQHARLTVTPNTGPGMAYELCGLASTNPIFVNNKKIPIGQTIILHPGDKILLGMTTVVLKSRI